MPDPAYTHHGSIRALRLALRAMAYAWPGLERYAEDKAIVGNLLHRAAARFQSIRKGAVMTDPKDLKLPTTTKEFAQYLRDIAAMVDRIPDRPLYLNEQDVEIGFYYENPMFPQMPTGIHFAIEYATTHEASET